MTAPTIGVCGFGRCGSTMTMAMLHAGGVPPLDIAHDLSYETDAPTDIYHVDLTGRAVKLLDFTTHYPLPTAPPTHPAAHWPHDVPGVYEWRFIWLDRDPTQQARSTVKLLDGLATGLIAGDSVERLATSYARDRPAILGQLRNIGPVLVLQYERCLAQPVKAAKAIAMHVGHLPRPFFDVGAARFVVHRRGPECRPDLAFELGQANLSNGAP